MKVKFTVPFCSVKLGTWNLFTTMRGCFGWKTRKIAVKRITAARMRKAVAATQEARLVLPPLRLLPDICEKWSVFLRPSDPTYLLRSGSVVSIRQWGSFFGVMLSRWAGLLGLGLQNGQLFLGAMGLFSSGVWLDPSCRRMVGVMNISAFISCHYEQILIHSSC